MGRTLYALLFTVILPLGLVAWARATNGSVHLPTPHSAVFGWSLAGIGLAVVLEAMRELWVHGRGLPMNAYPPQRLVTSGVYRLVPHPIYTGFTFASAGVSIAAGSSGGLWLVTPAVAAACVALVLGYEGPALRARFGGALGSTAGKTASSRVRRVVAALAAFAIAGACTVNGAVTPSVFALLLGVAILTWPPIWTLVLRICERVANSWSCLRVGPLRIINYAAYAGLAAATGLFLATSLAGPDHAWTICIIAIISLACAGLWGQVLVGSPTLLRPFGYFGALIGAAAGLAWVAFTQGLDALWLLAGALAVCAPWVVAIGRLRCLVQGCCHGKPFATGRGIHYRHPLSRACRIAHLDGQNVHAVPAYSMVNNCAIGVFLAWLWTCNTPLSMVAGIYLLLAGLTRFVEESLRGEPQTQIIAGLRIYQWLAIGSTVAGACITALPTPIAPGTFVVSWQGAAAALLVSAAYAFAMGVDFPESNRRFSRLI